MHKIAIYRRMVLDKVAVIELNTNDIKLVFADVIKNKSFLITNELVMPINLTKDFYAENIIKNTIVKEVVNILSVVKKMIDEQGVTDTICVATNFVKEAKNQQGFLNEIFSITNLKFNILSPEEEINNVYTAIINSFNKPKALIINITDYTTEVLLYNRRNIINTQILPFGSINLFRKFISDNTSMEELCKVMENEIFNQIKDMDWIRNLEEEFEVIGAGKMFLNLGTISRKAKKYPIDVEHNYEMTEDDFEKVYSVIKGLEPNKNAKIKGVSVEDTKYLPAGLSIIGAFIKNMNKKTFSISKTNNREGILLNYTIPLTLEKPISDNLGYSLQVLNEYYDKKPNNAEHVYNLSMILFKQLKVLHKLNRSYVRVLRVASYMYSSGLRVNYINDERISFNVILNSQIYGVSHNELVLACFVSMLRNSDNLNLADWVRYKDLVTEEDLDAVKKLAVILQIAVALDCTGFNHVNDISCDILGDSVIMKTITNGDCYLEIKQAMYTANEFKKAYNKNLEIL